MVAGCMLALFDAIIRRPAHDDPLVLSMLLNENGGYSLSTTVCRSGRTFESATRTAELVDPKQALVRGTRCVIRPRCSMKFIDLFITFLIF